MTAPQRVAILGAGPAGLAAAWHLSDPRLHPRPEVTVYQMGWRAGGQCGTGRVGQEQWVNQNGTHYLFGCYHQCLGLMAGAFQVLAEHDDTRFGSYEEQLVPRDFIFLKQLYQNAWTDWALWIPPNASEPEGAAPPTLLHGVCSLFRAAIERLLAPATADHFRAGMAAISSAPGGILGALLARVEALVADPFERFARGAIAHAAERVRSEMTPAARSTMIELAQTFRSLGRDVLTPLADLDLTMLRVLLLTDLAMTVVIGALTDRAYTPEGMEALDAYDFRAWLRIHGGLERAITSPATQVWYDAIAAFAGGSAQHPSAAAGASLTCVLELLFNYRGSVAYQLANEIGDSFVGPIVAALEHRGVRFAFFHRVWDIVPGEDGRIARVVLEKQAAVRGGDFAYAPFIPGVQKGRVVWPDDPNWEQLDHVYGPKTTGMWQTLLRPSESGPGAPLAPTPLAVAQAPLLPLQPSLESADYPQGGPEVVLRDGVDFDVVIAALRHTMYRASAPSLIAASPRWRAAVDNVGALETQSLRIWFRCDPKTLGWHYPAPILSSYILPYATWEDPSPVLASEDWGGRCKTVCHLFGPLSTMQLRGPGIPQPLEALALQNQRAVFDATTWLEYAPGTLWPGACAATDPLRLRNDLVEAIQIRPNTGLDQRYTAILPGTAKHRLRAAQTGYPNLVVAGDWTRTRLLSGSVEGAVDSGRAAASAALNALGA